MGNLGINFPPMKIKPLFILDLKTNESTDQNSYQIKIICMRTKK